ncbi:DUF4190 domain-containing protein [Streptomyces sp. NPDC058240]|uniref:DUF4190 domain-containing protein n=1 Tax=Streptomyces sp. NPDC058240 TaxID=3346396 RepID=UPI0036E6D7FF
MNTQGMERSPNGTAPVGAGPVPSGPRGPGHGVRPAVGGNGPAGAAVVLGVISLTTSIVFVGGPLGLIGLVLGLVALRTAKRTGAGRGRAITGVVASAIAIVVSVLVAVCTVWYANKTQECYQPDSFRQYTQCVRQQLSGV